MDQIHGVLSIALCIGTVIFTAWCVAILTRRDGIFDSAAECACEAGALTIFFVIWIGVAVTEQPWLFSASGLLVVSAVSITVATALLVQQLRRMPQKPAPAPVV